jgi:hypothetical protein
MLLEILLGVFVPIIFSLVHTIISVYLIYTNGNLSALAWNMIGFITKTMFMLFMTYIGVFVLGFDFRIYIPLLCISWFVCHVSEALYTTHHMNENCSEYLKSIIR